MVNKFDDTFGRFYTVPACDGPTDRQTSFDIVIHAYAKLNQQLGWDDH